MNKASKIEVIFITGSWPPFKCGVGDYSKVLAEKLAKDGVSLQLIKTADTSGFDAIRLLDVKSWGVKQLFKIVRTIKSEPAKIIHIQYPALGYKKNLGINLLPYALKVFTPNKKIIVTLHEYHDSSVLGRIRNLITILAVDKIIVSNELDKTSLPGFLQNKAEVVRIGSNIALYTNNKTDFKDLLNRIGLDYGRKTVVFFGFAFSQKNIELVIDAMEYLPNMQLLLITSLEKTNDYHQKLIDYISNSKSKKRIGITGFLDERLVSIALQNCKYFALPQTTPITGKSGSAVAAVNHGNILVVTGSDDSKPFVDRENAIFLHTPSSNEIVESINLLESNDGLKKKINNNSVKLSKEFGWDCITKKHVKIYSGVVRDKI